MYKELLKHLIIFFYIFFSNSFYNVQKFSLSFFSLFIFFSKNAKKLILSAYLIISFIIIFRSFHYQKSINHWKTS